MNDDVTTCPNCLKDMSALAPMKEVAPKNLGMSFYYMIFGIIIFIGGILASLSQRINKNNYYSLYQEALSKSSSSSEEATSLASNYYISFKSASFREVSFIVVSCIGLGLLVYGVVRFIIKKHQKG
jgi:hypothetical protein